MRKLSPAAVLAARPVPALDGQLDMFAVGDDTAAAQSQPGCSNPDTCTDYDPCPPCLAEARSAGLGRAQDTDPEGTDR